jgi:glycosyltransferase involved in cell wall biosynthesis
LNVVWWWRIVEASLIIPVHNEAIILENNTKVILRYLRTILTNFEILLIENGSQDETGNIAKILNHENEFVRVLFINQPCLGEALKRGIKESNYDKIIYFPIDLSVSLDFIQESVILLDSFDIVVGSKHLISKSDTRRIHRRLLSIYYHWLVRKICRTIITDTTCVKAYNKKAILPVIDEISSISHIFETELMLEAERKGVKIIEIPVNVIDNRKSRQAIRKKIQYKLRDLMTYELSYIAFLIGVPVLILGFLIIIYLIYLKLKTGITGFHNPYSFLISILMLFTGIQFIFFGLLANMMIQIRKKSVK